MEVKFSSSKIKLTFAQGEHFEGRSVRMSGEALYDGFDAALSTMEWVENGVGYSVTEEEKKLICKAIEERNKYYSFKVRYMEE